MTARELIQKFKDKNKIMEDKMIAGMVVYGSRVNNYGNDQSDLDVFLISNGENTYKAMQKIDDISIDSNIVSLNHIFDLIEQDKEEHASYYSSVFNTGIVEKNEEGIVDYIKDKVNERFLGENDKRKMYSFEKIQLGNLFARFNNINRNKLYDDYLYYNLLDKIRTNYFYINNYSRLSFPKVYDVFRNNRFITVYYQLRLPNKDFIDLYLNALSESDYDKRLELLRKMFTMIGIDSHELYSYNAVKKNAQDNLALRMFYLREKIVKVETMLINKHLASDYVYNIMLYRLKEFFWLLGSDEVSVVDEEFNAALLAKDIDERIKYLEALFAHIDKKFNIDYDNCLIKKY